MNAVATPVPRMRPEWMYLADKAASAAPSLTEDQRAYALTERRMLAHSQHRNAVLRAQAHPHGSPEREEWLGIARACYREMRRVERAEIELLAERMRTRP